jgi:tRNA modification GTPase
MSDTIYAVSSGIGRAGVAVIRISGPQARSIGEAMAGVLPADRTIGYSSLRDPAGGDVLDRGLVLWFAAPRSFTGEDCLEFQIHGGRAVIAAVLRAIGAFPKCRPAEPGEFTKRAFLNGKMDLTVVEGLADLIDSDTELQRQQAMRQYEGGLARKVDGWRMQLIEVMALVEASIDFVDEGEAPAFKSQALINELETIRTEVRAALATSRHGEIVREGFVVLISGPPNAGKSSLLNAIAQRDVAIVSDIPGTTRDLVEVLIDLDGVPVVLVDSAGIRETDDPVERIGIDRVRRRAEHADLVLWLSEAEADDVGAEAYRKEGRPMVLVRTKADRAGRKSDSGELAISSRTGAGLPDLIGLIRSSVSDLDKHREPAIVTSDRQRLVLLDAEAGLGRAIAAAPLGQPELLAEELRRCALAFTRISGKVGVEDLLDSIFARFCFGK